MHLSPLEDLTETAASLLSSSTGLDYGQYCHRRRATRLASRHSYLPYFADFLHSRIHLSYTLPLTCYIAIVTLSSYQNHTL